MPKSSVILTVLVVRSQLTIAMILVIIAIMDDRNDLGDHDGNDALMVQHWLRRTIDLVLAIERCGVPYYQHLACR